MIRPRIRPVALVFLLSVAPLSAIAAPYLPALTTPATDLPTLAKNITIILDASTIIAVSIGIFYYFKGIAGAMSSSNAKGWQDMRERALWGLLAIFVMLSIWGILRVISNTLFGSDNFTVR